MPPYLRALFLVLLTSGLITAGCSTTGSVLDTLPGKVEIPMTGFELEVVGKRPDVEDRELAVPVLSFFWNDDRLSPPFSDRLLHQAADLIRSTQIGGRCFLKFQLELVEGLQLFDRSPLREIEDVRWELRLAANQGEGEPAAEAVGQSDLRRISPDASRNRINKMYSEVFTAALEAALFELQRDPGLINTCGREIDA